MKGFNELEQYRTIAEKKQKEIKRFLPGSWIFEHDGRRKRELEQTPEAMAVNLRDT